MHFGMKSYLKSNRYHINKHTLTSGDFKFIFYKLSTIVWNINFVHNKDSLKLQ